MESIEAALDGMNNRREDFFYWVIKEKATDDFMGLVSLDFLSVSSEMAGGWICS
ncbi:hypothetical protein RFW18_02935 [Metabacillus idriensis]|uniref:hypothetical protein n=1 Tax=Metabacillus idriensis TaxID=324768 RepID=UPI0028145DC7|nr:hypothetical protein [Metabacillus idriensis]MDR0136685.1 hypothetical protein [Metabacillus idriensis]